eukprot:2442032-Alexandrium_andersonii.AAC.1
MSASLVGSEMCIRDRTAEGAALEDALAGRRVLAHHPRAAAARARRAGPVSYTHLTLPTICSV